MSNQEPQDTKLEFQSKEVCNALFNIEDGQPEPKLSPFDIGCLMAQEANRAASIYPKFNSAHEGYAVLLEEVDELWDEVKKKHHDPEKMEKEAMQVGAMAIRFIYDCIKGKT